MNLTLMKTYLLSTPLSVMRWAPRLIQFITSFLLTGAFIKTSFMQGFFCWKLDRFIHILFTLIHSQYCSLPQIQDFPRGRKISPPPPAFRKIGDRLLTQIGKGKGQRFPPALVSSKRGKDGYTFRQVEPIGQQLERVEYSEEEQKYFIIYMSR